CPVARSDRAAARPSTFPREPVARGRAAVGPPEPAAAVRYVEANHLAAGRETPCSPGWRQKTPAARRLRRSIVAIFRDEPYSATSAGVFARKRTPELAKPPVFAQ